MRRTSSYLTWTTWASVPNDIYDGIPSDEMPDLFKAFIEYAPVIRAMRSLLDKNDPTGNEEYFRAMVETLQDLLPTDGDTALSIAEAVLSAQGGR